MSAERLIRVQKLCKNQIKPLHIPVPNNGGVFKAKSTIGSKSFMKYLAETGSVVPDAAT